jgi:hypothetical protein
VKYFTWYFDIIKNRLENPLAADTYGEKHHVLPKSIYPQYKKAKWNQVKLTAREHYICHMLLVKIFKNTKYYYKMLNAYVAMIPDKSGNRVGPKGLMYEKYRKEYSKFMSENNPMKRPEVREKVTGENHYMTNPNFVKKYKGWYAIIKNKEKND